MITILIQPVAHKGGQQAGRRWQLLFASLRSRLDAGQQAYLEACAEGNADWRSRMSLLARAMVLDYLPGEKLRLLPDWRLMAGKTHVSPSYSSSCIFCGLGEQPLGLDAQELVSGARAAAFAEFFARIRPDWPEQAGHSALTRAWAVCEAILKLAGTGWSREAPGLLCALDFGRRGGSARGTGESFSWRTLPFHGHWLGIASAETGQISCKIMPALVL